MKNQIIKSVFFSILFFLVQSVCCYGQVKIYTIDGEIIQAEKVFVWKNKIEYSVKESTGLKKVFIRNRKVDKIVYADGKTDYYNDYFDFERVYLLQKRRNIKINLLAPLFGYTNFSFEQFLDYGRSFTLDLSIVGFGTQSIVGSNRVTLPGGGMGNKTIFRRQSGIIIGTSYKFFNRNKFYRDNERGHILKGGYFQPTFLFGTYKENVVMYTNFGFADDFERVSVRFVSLIAKFGKQWTFADRFVFDMHFGLGYVQGIKPESIDNRRHHFVFTRFDKNPKLVQSGGFKLGVLF